jgi:hypothetical protein
MLSLVAIIIISLLLIFFRESKYSFIDSNSLREWYGFIGAAFSGVVVGVGFYPLWKSCLVSFWLPAILGYNNVYYQNLELLLMVVNVFLVEIALPIAKWELTFVVMLKRKTLFVPPV